MNECVAAKSITFAYVDQPLLLKGVSLSVMPGECIALTGASGCGKSTLCSILCGIIPRSSGGMRSGEVFLFGKKLSELSLLETVHSVGIVFQNPDSQLFSPTVEDEIAFGPENICLPKEEIKKRIDTALELVNMQRYRYANPNTLSGGQKQLIALAAVLSLDPGFLIFDEALSQLDDASTALVLAAIQNLKNEGKGILMVEHDEENLNLADRILRLENGGITECRNR